MERERVSDGLLLSLVAEERVRVLGEMATSSTEASLGCGEILSAVGKGLDGPVTGVMVSSGPELLTAMILFCSRVSCLGSQ